MLLNPIEKNIAMTNNTDDLKIIEKYYRKDKTDTDIHRFYDRYLVDEDFRLKSEAFISMKSILPLLPPNAIQVRVKRTLSFKSVRIVIFYMLLLVLLGLCYFLLQNPKNSNQHNPNTDKTIEIPIPPGTGNFVEGSTSKSDSTLPKNQVLPINPTDKEKELIQAIVLADTIFSPPMGNRASSDTPNNKIERKRSILNERELDSLENKCLQMAKNDPLNVHFTEFQALGHEAFRLKEFKWAFDRFKTFYDNEKNNLTSYQSAYITYKMLLCIVGDWEHLKDKSQEVLKTLHELELENDDKFFKNNFDRLQVDLQQTGSLGKEISKALNNAKVYN
jgi:hypothetical protein